MMSIPLRIIGGAPGAILVTALIFLILALAIHNDQDVQLDEDRTISINVLRQLEDRSLAERPEFERPVLDQPPPPPPVTHDPTFRPTVGTPIGAVPDLAANLNIGTGFNPDRDAQPLVRIPPQYPTQCAGSASASETVVVQFNVTPEGTVINEEVLHSTNRCFNRAALRAVQRWRFAPRIVNNQAQPRFGVQTAIDFGLDEG